MAFAIRTPVGTKHIALTRVASKLKLFSTITAIAERTPVNFATKLGLEIGIVTEPYSNGRVHVSLRPTLIFRKGAVVTSYKRPQSLALVDACRCMRVQSKPVAP